MLTKATLHKEALVLARNNGEVRLDYGKLRRAALTLRALNHPLRKTMITMMEQKPEITVTEIYKTMKIEQSVASQHLAIMRRAGVVTTRREGKTIHYYPNTARIEEITKLVEQLAQPQ